MGKKLKQIKILDLNTYDLAKNDETGFYVSETVETFEDYVNFELSVLFDNGYIVESIQANNEKSSFVIVYNIEIK